MRKHFVRYTVGSTQHVVAMRPLTRGYHHTKDGYKFKYVRTKNGAPAVVLADGSNNKMLVYHTKDGYLNVKDAAGKIARYETYSHESGAHYITPQAKFLSLIDKPGTWHGDDDFYGNGPLPKSASSSTRSILSGRDGYYGDSGDGGDGDGGGGEGDDGGDGGDGGFISGTVSDGDSDADSTIAFTIYPDARGVCPPGTYPTGNNTCQGEIAVVSANASGGDFLAGWGDPGYDSGGGFSLVPNACATSVVESFDLAQITFYGAVLVGLLIFTAIATGGLFVVLVASLNALLIALGVGLIDYSELGGLYNAVKQNCFGS